MAFEPKSSLGDEQPIECWNECLLAFVLGASSRHHPIDPDCYPNGFAACPTFQNGANTMASNCLSEWILAVRCFFAHYSSCGLDPRGLRDRMPTIGSRIFATR